MIHTLFRHEGILRLLPWVFVTNRVCHVWCNFWPNYMFRTTVIFGTLKDGSLEINSFALNNCFGSRNVFQNGVNSLSKMVLKKLVFFFVCLFVCLFFCQKAQNVVYFWTIRFSSNFTNIWCKYLSNNVRRDFRLPMSALSIEAGESFNGKLTAKVLKSSYLRRNNTSEYEPVLIYLSPLNFWFHSLYSLVPSTKF